MEKGKNVPSGSNPVCSMSVRCAVDDNASAAVLDRCVVHLDGTTAVVLRCRTSAYFGSCSVPENLFRTKHVGTQLRSDQLRTSG